MDEMTPRERIDAAIALKPVDRVPVIPELGVFSPRYQGVKLARCVKNPGLATEAMIKTFDDLGGWDATYLGGGVMGDLGFSFLAPIAIKLPGHELGEDDLWQLDEKEVMKVEDYDWILEHGWLAFTGYAFPRLGSHVPPEQFLAVTEATAAQGVKDVLAWEHRGVPVLCGMGGSPPFEQLSLTRSMKEMTIDLYRRPEKVIATMERMMEDDLQVGIGGMKALQAACSPGPRVAFIGATRGTFLSPKFFDRFFWPYLKRMVLAFLDAGITPLLHFDSNWTPFLDHFLELPARQVILDLDSITDIFKAKQVLRGHMCLMGDVPPAMLKLGTPDEVTAYVKKLIDVVGEGGGYILSTGCDSPIDSKPENIKAMVDTGKAYYPHHRVF